MAILTRFRDIMASNINAILDKVEDPEKMIEQCLRNLNSDLGKVRAETASIIAEEHRAKRALDELIEEMNKMQSYAIKALEANNEDDARKFLEKKSTLAAKEAGLKEAYDLAAANANKMREMHDKLVADIRELEARKDMIKGKLAVAKTQERMNRISSSVNSTNNSLSAFDRMEEKANLALDKANAMADLSAGTKDDIKNLKEKYDNAANIDSELEALKASLKK
ncbi:phage shock protein A (PspA) family protein [Geosporobacter subterraneus DSM 17957]|uniref:Phage shock protein A (PspA) family protein n=1 Tax=Geosporobacter subterraneus DSM 17957 TaxID=1121919 RepID=A0A1M6L0X6_9FIRM|nr:PspA/IM30 family protein [Geosporobacter subterraneus]SHJ64789.1 phage shock protein A (PspA) family protein [Geosporobacter subterraneus DSM 17957]